MNSLSDLIWIEFRKAIRSRMPLWTSLGSLLMPLGIAFLIFVSQESGNFQKAWSDQRQGKPNGICGNRLVNIHRALRAGDWGRRIHIIRPGHQLDVRP